MLRLFDDGEPHARRLQPALPTSSRCSTPSPTRAGRANALAFRLKLLLAAGFAPAARRLRRAAASASTSAGFSGAAGGVVCARLRGGRVPARRGGARRSWSTRSAARWPRRPRRPQRALAPGRARDRRDARAPRARAAGGRVGVESAAPVRRGRHKWVYDFSEGSRDMRDLLGGKGANVAEMTRVLGAERVPGRASRSPPRPASPT